MEATVPPSDPKNSREHVMANLASIRVGKTKLLKMLANLKGMEDKGEEVDKTTISRLVDAYDSLNKQEEDYIRVIRDIIQKQVIQYANEVKKDKNEQEDENSNAEDIIKEVDEIEQNAVAASQKYDLLVSTLKDRLEKKKLLDQIHQIEQPQTDTQSELLEQLELTKLRLANEKEALDRTEEVRDRLRREAAKRGYLQKPGNEPNVSSEVKVSEPSGDQRVPPLLTETQVPTQQSETASTEETHAKIQRHIDQIKARKQRMHECYAQAQEMLSLKKAYDDAVKRTKELETMQQSLQNLKVEQDATKEDEQS